MSRLNRIVVAETATVRDAGVNAGAHLLDERRRLGGINVRRLLAGK